MFAEQCLLKAMAEFCVAVIYTPIFVFSSCVCGSLWQDKRIRAHACALIVCNKLFTCAYNIITYSFYVRKKLYVTFLLYILLQGKG